METPYVDKALLPAILERNEAFWKGELKEGPLVWATAPDGLPGHLPRAPAVEAEEWTDVGYVMAKAEHSIAHTVYAGDALPTHNPWLGPDQFAAWLGADITFAPRDDTSWVKPFVEDWSDHPKLSIDPGNRWWKLYLEILRASVERGRGRWVTCYPDLHSGIDGLAAIRGSQVLMLDLVDHPELVKDRMGQMTQLWKEIVDQVSGVMEPGGQGSTNWTLGWSAGRFVCLGQNDFSCLVGPGMFDEFILEDTVECCGHVDHIIYHLDGPGALQHLPRLLEIGKIDCIQWIQGAGAPLPSNWLPLLKRIQDAGKSVQLFYGGAHGGKADFGAEIDALCGALDTSRLFIAAVLDTPEAARFVVDRARSAGRK
ncbi:MAG: hypothetical protein WCQ50_04860 [Spirochaetota bacterium]